MPKFEKEFSNSDYQLIAEENQSATLTDNDYVRIIVYRKFGFSSSQIVTMGGNDKAIFYSSLASSPFQINISPFGAGLDETKLKIVGGDDNDFKIFENPDGNIYIKPNEIFNDYRFPQGDYRIQIDFLRQVKPSIASVNEDLSAGYLGTLPFPTYTEEFNISQYPGLDASDIALW